MSTTTALFLSTFFMLSLLPRCSSSSSSSNVNRGFQFRLIHRDSPLSPLYDPNASVSSRSKSAYKRSVMRYNHIRFILDPHNFDLDVTATPHNGEYFMEVSIGSPPVRVMAMIDTASDLIWTLCHPCIRCNPNATSIFNPYESSTYFQFSCFSDTCNDLRWKACTDDLRCHYRALYKDFSGSSGVLGADFFTMSSANGSTVSLGPIIFGCGSSNGSAGVGIAGLSNSTLSLVTQLGRRKFSHCFVPQWSMETDESHLLIGENAVMYGNSTPLTDSENSSGLGMYFINLEDISVGNDRLRVSPGTFRYSKSGDGSLSGVIIDSGTPYTHLHYTAYNMLVEKLMKVVKLEAVIEVDDAWDLCFRGGREELVEENIPIITFHFSGLDVPVMPQNTFDVLSNEFEGGTMVCLAMAPVEDLSIIGNFVQQNMNVGFDLERSEVTFAPAVCSTF